MTDEELRILATDLVECLSSHLSYTEQILFRQAVLDSFRMVRDKERIAAAEDKSD